MKIHTIVVLIQSKKESFNIYTITASTYSLSNDTQASSIILYKLDSNLSNSLKGSSGTIQSHHDGNNTVYGDDNILFEVGGNGSAYEDCAKITIKKKSSVNGAVKEQGYVMSFRYNSSGNWTILIPK